MSEAFVPASELYDIESRTPIAHPAHQATDADVRRALERRKIRTDGGNASSGTEQRRNGNRNAGFEPAPHYVIGEGSVALELDDVHGWIRHRSSRAVWYLLTHYRKSLTKRCVLPYFSFLPDCILRPETDREGGER